MFERTSSPSTVTAGSMLLGQRGGRRRSANPPPRLVAPPRGLAPMGRSDGFEIADTDTGMMSDPKILALARRLRDPIRTLACVALYDAVRLASWRSGRRLRLDETIPGWVLEPVDDLIAHLIAVHLLDPDQRIPIHAWEGWYGPARDRRERYRQLGSKGGLAKAALAHARPSAIPLALPRPSGRYGLKTKENE